MVSGSVGERQHESVQHLHVPAVCCRDGREDRYYIVQNKQQAREDEAKAAKERRKKVSDCLRGCAHIDVPLAPNHCSMVL